MAELDALPEDQRAALQLLLKQGQRYDQLASLLGIGPEAVRDRAHAALETLGPPTDLAEADRAEVADYLLGQQDPAQRAATRELLAGSAPARAWARSVAGALRPLAGEALPEIPAESGGRPRAPAPAAEPAGFEASEEVAAGRTGPKRPSSRLGGALLLGGIGIVVAVVLILLISGGGNDKSKSSTVSPSPSTQTSTGQQRPLAQINLFSTSGDSKQVGLAQVFQNANRRAIIVAGQGLNPGAYALWLYNSASDAKLLGFVPQRVGKDGRFATQGELPTNAERYKQLVVTRETVTRNTRQAPSTPGTVVLKGDLKLS